MVLIYSVGVGWEKGVVLNLYNGEKNGEFSPQLDLEIFVPAAGSLDHAETTFDKRSSSTFDGFDTTATGAVAFRGGNIGNNTKDAHAAVPAVRAGESIHASPALTAGTAGCPMAPFSPDVEPEVDMWSSG